MEELATKIYIDQLLDQDRLVKENIKRWLLGAMIPLPVILLVVNDPLVMFFALVIAHSFFISLFLIYHLYQPGV